MTPRAIHYSAVPCELGWLLVAATRRGVCCVRFGDRAETLIEELAGEFPFAELRDRARHGARDGASGEAHWMEPWVERLCDLAAGRIPDGEIPLEVSGSRFQRRVWDAIRTIPHGETRTYGELARGLGRPRSARAVARACAANPVALAVPCHRVVPVSGGPGGYAFGAERKRRLLSAEKESDLSLSFSRVDSPDGRRPLRSTDPSPTHPGA